MSLPVDLHWNQLSTLARPMRWYSMSEWRSLQEQWNESHLCLCERVPRRELWIDHRLLSVSTGKRREFRMAERERELSSLCSVSMVEFVRTRNQELTVLVRGEWRARVARRLSINVKRTRVKTTERVNHWLISMSVCVHTVSWVCPDRDLCLRIKTLL